MNKINISVFIDRENKNASLELDNNFLVADLLAKLKRQEKDGEQEDTTLEKLIKFVEKSETIEQLLRVFDFFDMYTEEQLLSIHLPTRIDRQALYLFGAMAQKASTKDGARAVLKEIGQHRFFSAESRAAAVSAVEHQIEALPEGLAIPEDKSKKADHTARKEFLRRIRDVSTLTQLEVLLKELYETSAFDTQERAIVRGRITVKGTELRRRKKP